MNFETDSERIFYELCDLHGYVAKKNQERSKEEKKTADFTVNTPFQRFIAEVKELRPNEHDLVCAEKFLRGDISGGSYTVGKRVRSEINGAKAQLKAHIKESIPIILVLFSNMQIGEVNLGPHRYLSAPEIDAAMFGFLTVGSVRIPVENRPKDRSGGGRTTTEKEKNYLSAICVLSDFDRETIYVYHNPFATYPLKVEVFSEFKGEQYFKALPVFNHPQKWIRHEC